MTEREKMHTGEVYDPEDPEILQWQLKRMDLLYEFNHTRPSDLEQRSELLREMLAEIGEGCFVEQPFYSNFAGAHVHFGRRVYANFGLTCVDDTHIYVGDYTMFGPHVTLATATHPIDPEPRTKGLQYNLPIRIGRNCFIGARTVVTPGVTIGDNSVIGAGSVVTKDIPANAVAVGNPCRVIREIKI